MNAHSASPAALDAGPCAEDDTTTRAIASGDSVLASMLRRGPDAPADGGHGYGHAAARAAAVTIGELVALADGRVPLVRHPDQDGFSALPARTTVAMASRHVGKSVVLMFEDGDARRPIVLGVLQDDSGWNTDERPAQVEVDSDGQHLTVNAKSELVLRCGKARITLNDAGKIVIEGTHIVSRASASHRIKGGSVQIN